MSTEIDQRVVEMKFDNKNFEKNIATSMDSLKRFKDSLKFEGATEGIKEIEKETKNFDLSRMERAVDGLSSKFKVLSITAIDSILRIKRRVEDAAVKLVKSLSTDNIIAGWNKLAEKTEQVQTIMNATGKSIDEVNNYLDKLMWFSDETSYGFNDMTKAIAQMTSSGGDIEKLIPMVEGVANATAFAGKSADVFSRVMYNLNQSYATGALKYIDWKSLEMAGVASEQLKQTLIDTAVALGTIKEGEVTIANFGETLKKDWATTEVMEKGFGYFAEMSEKAFEMVKSGEAATATEAYNKLAKEYDTVSLRAAKAAQEAMTFKQVLDATKDAVSSKWMKTFEIIFGNYEEAKRLWSDLAEAFYSIFAEGGDSRNDLLTEALQHRKAIFQDLQDKGLPSIADLKTYLIEAASASDELDDSMKELIKNNFDESLKEGWLNTNLLSTALAKAAKEGALLSDEQLKAKGYTDAQIKSMREFATALYSGKINIKELADELSRMTGRENLVAAFWNLWDALFAVDEETEKGIGILAIFRDALRDLFPPLTAEKIYDFTVKLREFTEKLKLSEEQAEGLRNIFKLILSPVRAAVDAIKKVLTWGGKLIGLVGTLGGKLLSLASDGTVFGKFVNALFDDTKKIERIEKVNELLRSVQTELGKLKTKTGELFDRIQNVPIVSSFLTTAKEKIKEIGGVLSGPISTAVSYISNLHLSDVVQKISDGAASVYNWIVGIIDKLKQWKSSVDLNSIFNIDIPVLSNVVNGIRSIKTALQGLFKGAKPVKQIFTSLFGEKKKFEIGTVVKNSIDRISTAIVGLKTKVVDLWNSVKSNEKVSSILSKVSQALGRVFDFISDKIVKIINYISTLDFSKIIENTKNSLSGLGTFFKNSYESVKKFFSAFKPESFVGGLKMISASMPKVSEGTAKLGEAFEGSSIIQKFKDIITGAQPLPGVLEKLKNAIVNFAKGITPSKVLIFAFGITLISLFKNLSNLAESATLVVTNSAKLVENFSGIGAGIKGTITNVNKAITDMSTALQQSALKPKPLKELALAIVAFTAALVILSQIPKDDLIKAGIAVGAVTAVLLIATGLLTAMGKSVNKAGAAASVKSVSKAMVAIGVAFLALAGSLVLLGRVDTSDMADQLLAFTVILGEFVAAVLILGRKELAMGKAALTLLAFAGSLRLIVKALALLAGVDPSQIAAAAVGFIPVFGALVALAIAARIAGGKIGGGNSKSIILGGSNGGANILILIADLILLAKALQMLSKYDTTTILAGLPNFVIIMGLITALAVAARIAGKNSGKAGTAILAMSVSLLIIAKAISNLGAMQESQVWQGTAVVSALMVFFSIFAASTAKVGKDAKKISGPLLAVSIAITLLSVMIKSLGELSVEQAAQGTIAVGVLMGLCTLIVNQMGKAEKAAGVILSMTVLLAALTMAIAFLTNISSEGSDLTQATVALSTILLALGAAMWAMGKVANDAPKVGGIAKIIAEMTLILAALTGMFYILPKDLDFGNFDKFGLGVAEILVSLGLVVAALNKFASADTSNIKGTFVAIGEMAVLGTVLGGLAAGLSLLFGQPAFQEVFGNDAAVNSIKHAVELIAVLGAELSILTGVLGVIGLLGAGALSAGALGFLEVSAVVILLFGGVAALYDALVTDKDGALNPAKQAELTAALDGAVEIFDKIGEAIGKFVGSVVGGFASKSLEGYGEGVAAFFDSFKDIDTSAIENFKVLGDAMQSFSNAGLADIFGTLDLNDIGKQLNEFAPHIVTLSETLAEVDSNALLKLSDAATGMKGFGEFLEALPREGGIVGSILGDHQSLETFANGIGPFGEGLKAMIDAMPEGGIDTSVVQTAKDAGMMLAELQNALPARGGVLQEWIGDKETISVFATRLPSLAQGLVAFSNTIANGNFDSGKSKAAAEASKALAEFQTALPSRGGKLQTLLGEPETVSAFATRLPLLAEGLVAFSNKITEGKFDDQITTKAANAGIALAKLQDGLPNVGGKLADWFGDQMDLGSFGDNLRNLGEGLWWFSFYSEQLDLGSVQNATKVTEELVSIANMMDEGGVLANLFKDSSNKFKKFGDALEQFGGSFKLFADNVSNVDWDGATRAANVIDQLVSCMQNLSSFSELQAFGNSLEVLGYQGIEAFTGAFEDADAEGSVTKAGESLVNTIRNAITDNCDSDMNYAATIVVGAFFVHFTSYFGKRSTSVADGAMTTIKGALITASMNGDLETAGKFIVQGIENGIESNWYLLLSYIKRKAPSIVQAFQEAMAIESPSKVMRNEVGVYIVQGIAEGIKDDMSAEEQAKKKAENIVSAFQEVLNRHDLEIEAIELDFKTQRLENPFLSKEELKNLEIEELEKKLEKSVEKYKTQEAEFRAVAQKFDKDSDQYLEASNKRDKAWIEFLELQQTLANAKASADEPQLVFDSTGTMFIQGFLYNVTSDMSMEDAAAQKAANIIAAFDKEFERYDYSAGLRNAQKSLWDLYNPEYNEHIEGRGKTAAEQEQLQQEASTNQMLAKIIKNKQDMAEAADQANLADAEYRAFIESGIQNDEVLKELFTKKNEAQEKLVSLANEQYSFKQYLPAWERANAKLATMTQEEIDNFFYNIPDDNPILQIVNEALEGARQFNDIQFDFEDVFAPLTDNEALSSITDDVQVIFEEDIPALIEAASAAGGGAGYDYGTAIGENIFGAIGDVYDQYGGDYLASLFGSGSGILGSASGLLSQGVDAIGNIDVAGAISGMIDSASTKVTNGFGNLAQNGVDGFLGTITGASSESKETGVGFVNEFLSGASGEKGLDSHSPSKATEQLAIYAVMGFHKGILEKLGILNTDGVSMSNAILEPMSGIVAKIDQVLQSDLDVQPVISPVLDLTSVTSAAGQLNGMLDMSASYNMAVRAYTEAEEARSAREKALAQMVIDGVGAHLAGIGASLDDLRDVVEAHGDSDLIIDVNVDGAALARMTVNDYLYASRANGTPFYEANLF